MKPEPVSVVHLFPELLEHLINTLSRLAPHQWDTPTGCPGWSVHDVGLHLLGDDLGQLSWQRDSFEASWIDSNTWKGLVTSLNRKNQRWVESARNMSPRLVCDLLRFSGTQIKQHFESLDLDSGGPEVSWARSGPAPMWLHVAREYTERWHHQQQIRQAVGIELLLEPRFFRPVVATFVHGLPRSYRDELASEGTTVQVSIIGESGGEWYLTRQRHGWALHVGTAPEFVSHVSIGQGDAWALFTKSISKEEVRPRIRVVGDEDLGTRTLDTVSIIA